MNVVLDVLLKREPFYKTAVDVLNLVKRKDVCEYISASAVTDIYYIACRQLKNKDQVRALLKNLLTVVSVAGVTEKEISNALGLKWNDFEASTIPIWLPENALSVFVGQSQSHADIEK